MHKRIRPLFAALIAAFACSIAAGSASANRSIEVTGGPNVLASGQLQIIGTEGGASLEITCDVTLHTTIARLVPKISGTLIGKITAISINRGGTTRSPGCRHGSFVREVHDILPLNCTHRELGGNVLSWDCSGAPAGLWKLIYDSFQGTLPRIEGINGHIQGAQFNEVLLEPFGGTIECLYEGSIFGLIEIVRETGTITRGRAVRERTGLARIRGSGLCPARATFSSAATITPTLTILLK